ncbi:MAG: hypothetical protein WDN72_03345 [Alphaproteobacteria bacterium]
MTWIAPHKLGAGDVVIAEPAESGKGNFRLLQIPEVNGAMVVMEPSTGKVLAMSGGYSWGGTVFNRATAGEAPAGLGVQAFRLHDGAGGRPVADLDHPRRAGVAAAGAGPADVAAEEFRGRLSRPRSRCASASKNRATR